MAGVGSYLRRVIDGPGDCWGRCRSLRRSTMYRHQLRFVLRFGVQEQFTEFAGRLHQAESARGWAPPRAWQAINGRVNEIVIEHDYPDFQTFQAERGAFHDDPGKVGEVLAVLAELAVPGTAVQSDLDGFEFSSATA